MWKSKIQNKNQKNQKCKKKNKIMKGKLKI